MGIEDHLVHNYLELVDQNVAPDANENGANK